MQTVVLTAYKLGLIYSQLAFPADIVLQTHISVAPDPQTHTRPPKQTWPTSLIRASRLRKEAVDGYGTGPCRPLVVK